MILYRILNFHVRHGMVVEKVYDKILFKQSKWLEKPINFNTQKRNQAVNEYGKDLNKLLNKAFCEKTMENGRNRMKVEFIKEDVNEKIIKQQSKLTFKGIHKSYNLW